MGGREAAIDEWMRWPLLLCEEASGDTHLHPWQYSLVPRPTCAFHFSAAVGLVPFLTCVTHSLPPSCPPPPPSPLQYASGVERRCP